MAVVAGIADLHVAERILKHVGLFDQPRAPNVHDCPTPPSTPDGQTLVMFTRRPGRITAGPATGTWTGDPAPDEYRTESLDPGLNDEWPVDPPFEQDLPVDPPFDDD